MPQLPPSIKLTIGQLFKYILEFSLLKTLRINLKYFTFKDAIKMPIIVSKHVKFSRLSGRCDIKHKSFACIRLGFNSLHFFDNNYSRSIWHNEGKIKFEGRATLGNGFKIYVTKSGSLTIGQKFHLSGESTIISNHEIIIGNSCLFSWGILIMDTDFHKVIDKNSNTEINKDQSVLIGNSCWIGCRVLILKGANIPKSSIIAANATISKNLTYENCIYGGFDGTILKKNIKWDY